MGKSRSWEPVIDGETARIPLTQGKWAVIDLEDLPLLLGPPWQAYQPNLREDRFYASSRLPGPRSSLRRKMHRVILGLDRGDRRMVDHRDGNGLNNRRSNLRLATPGENCANQRPQVGRTSQYKGVSWDNRNRKWAVGVKRGDVRRRGYFLDEVEAAAAHDRWALELHGEFARLNFPEEMQA